MMLALIAGVISEVSVPSLVALAVLWTEHLHTGAQGEVWVCGRLLQEEGTGA